MIFKIKTFLNYLITAKTKYRIHSPFLYDFRIHVLDDNIHFYPFNALEHLRRKMHHDDSIIEITDLGVGSKNKKLDNKRSIQQIAKTSLKSPKYSRMIFRLINHYGYKNILELGTSLGLTTAYMASVDHKLEITTIEGCPEIHKKACDLFKLLELNNIKAINADFTTALDELLCLNPSFDLVFIDGNHSYEATLSYFERILPYCSKKAAIIVDDIHWSEEMHKAWLEIKANEQIKISVNIYEMGLLFFNEQIKEKEDFKIYY